MAEKNNNLDLYYKFLNQEITKIQLLSYVPQEVLHRSINAEINDETIQTILNKFDVLLGKEQVRGVIGGPPCQAFSTIGRAQNAHKKATDGRIYLYRYYIDFLERYSPDFFVFENVKGLLSFKDADGEPLLAKIIKEFNEAGYSLGYRIENTKNYGVPQSRERIIIFGVPLGHESLIESFFQLWNHFKNPKLVLKKH
ncbi:C-5 cytosine-specific DNA methylase [Leuconostocaceae bacterium R-53105]|uniref:DNA (cytosine-5-)-methyltransferase n=1 Tax=Convivina intestini TaxID=1505726 RepID=A0A2U1DF22_9LACO|nr:C-5 cytosine-specific DNA methylase [Convivina intestini]CAH1851118.1 hypothetical protein R077811_00228 [Convivina intestini]SDB82042.1 C-5 cytosine-specific DNA methylase [Leuconostocaceae bacterium R-53105]